MTGETACLERQALCWGAGSAARAGGDASRNKIAKKEEKKVCGAGTGAEAGGAGRKGVCVCGI